MFSSDVGISSDVGNSHYQNTVIMWVFDAKKLHIYICNNNPREVTSYKKVIKTSCSVFLKPRINNWVEKSDALSKK